VLIKRLRGGLGGARKGKNWISYPEEKVSTSKTGKALLTTSGDVGKQEILPVLRGKHSWGRSSPNGVRQFPLRSVMPKGSRGLFEMNGRDREKKKNPSILLAIGGNSTTNHGKKIAKVPERKKKARCCRSEKSARKF